MLKKQLILLCSILLLAACNMTKFVPQGEYLLNDVKVKVQDTKQVPSSDLLKYVQQKQNTEILGYSRVNEQLLREHLFVILREQLLLFFISSCRR